MNIELARHSDDLAICIDEQCVSIPRYYRKPALYFMVKRRDRLRLQHELHTMSGWLLPALHINAILAAADSLRDGWTATARI